MSVDTPPDSGVRPHGTSTLERIGRACVRHRWIVIGAWVALLIVINGVAGAVGPDYRTDFTLPASETKEVQELLEANSPERAGFTLADRVPGTARGRRPRGASDDGGAVRLHRRHRGHHRHVAVRQRRNRSARTARSRSPRSTSPTPARSPNSTRSVKTSSTRATSSTRSRGSRSSTAATCSPRSSSPRARSTA